MMSGDQFYSDDETSGFDRPHIDWAEQIDFRRDELKHTSSCLGCGSREPVRIEGTTCSDCTDYPRCDFCRRWVGDGSGWLPGYVVATDETGAEVKVCDPCFLEVK